MFETALNVIFRICQIATILALIFQLIAPTKIGEKFWDFMRNHKVIGIIYFVTTAVGLLGTLFVVL